MGFFFLLYYAVNVSKMKILEMSGGKQYLQPDEADVAKMLAANTHLGTKQVNYQMEQYVYKRREQDGIHIINSKKTWEKLVLAARAIVAIENPADVYCISSRPMGQRAVLKFAHYTGATSIAGRFTPGAFTNQIQAAFREPRLLVVTDPHTDHQPVTEASYVNIPVIAFCTTDSPLSHVDIAIPSNTKGRQSIGLMWWLLAREVLRLRGTISRDHPWEIMPDLFFYRDPEEVEKEEKEALERAKEDQSAPPAQEWNQEPSIGVGDVGEWAAEVPVIQPTPVAPNFAAGGPTPGQAAAGTATNEDWNIPKMDDWSAEAVTAPAPEWGGAVP